VTEFVHLHCHSHYSLLDGAGRIGDLLDTVQGHGMEALALTDHGNLFGAVEFYKEAKKREIRPILGYEAYMAPSGMTDTSRNQRANGYYHMTLLAENRTGFQNLMKLASAAYLQGFYRKPRIDRAMLADHKEGIIALSGCLRSEICYALMREEQELAMTALDEYLQIFGEEHFFIELQYNGIREQKLVSEALIEVADRKGLRTVVTNDVHYPTPESARVHEVLLCIQTAKTLSDENRFKFQTDEFYLKSAEEMAQVFPGRPEAMANTLEIARRCDVQLDFEGSKTAGGHRDLLNHSLCPLTSCRTLARATKLISPHDIGLQGCAGLALQPSGSSWSIGQPWPRLPQAGLYPPCWAV